MKRRFAAAVLMILASATCAFAGELVTPAQFQKMEKFLDTMGVKASFPPPTAQNLGFTNDPTKPLDVIEIMTNDRVVYFCRSRTNPQDLVLWVRGPDGQSSFMFSMHPDFKPIRALYLHVNAFPQIEDVNTPQVKAVYEQALTALGKDVDRSPLPAAGAQRH